MLVTGGMTILTMFPSLWLSGQNFDGGHPSGDEVITGDASGRTKDSVGNAVTPSGTIKVVNDGGHSAYYFDKSNSITSAAIVNAAYSFVYVFRRPTLSTDTGRTFTGSAGNRLFGTWSTYVGAYHVDAWVIEQKKSSTLIECYIATNNAGKKNMWDVRLDQKLATDITLGANEWGQTVVGKPAQYGDQAGVVYVYEALLFEYALSAEQVAHIKTEFKEKYRIQFFSNFPVFFVFLLSTRIPIVIPYSF